MKRGKFEAPRTRRVHPILWIILLGIVVLGIVFLLKFCTPEGNTYDPLYTQPQQTQPSQPATTEPTSAPTTEPVTEPATEPTTEPVTEPVTEPSTEPTEPSTEPEEEFTPDSNLPLGQQIVSVAKAALGKPYAKGGNGPDGFDTSGLIRYCFAQCGVSVPRTTKAQYAGGEGVEKEDLQPGDVVFFYLETPGSADYMGIYTGENTFITVSSSENAVIERNIGTKYHQEHYVGARRFIEAE